MMRVSGNLKPSLCSRAQVCRPSAARKSSTWVMQQRCCTVCVGSSDAGSISTSTSSSDHPPAIASNSIPDGASSPSSSNEAVTSPPSNLSVLGRIKRFFLGDSGFDKKKLAELGLGAFAAYGVFSNMNAGVLTTICWVSVVKSTGLTPLEPGMWPKFLGLYAALYLTAGTITRPLRLTFAIAAAPAVERALASLQRITGLNKPTAYGLVLLAISAGSIVFFISSIALFGGFPYGLPNISQLFAAKG